MSWYVIVMSEKMQYKFRYDENLQYMVIHTLGKASVPCVRDALQKLIEYPDWNLGCNVLVDCHELSVLHLNTEEIRMISNFVKQHNKNFGIGKWAFVMKHEKDYGMARIWQAYTEYEVGFKSEIFTSFQEAQDWLKQSSEL